MEQRYEVCCTSCGGAGQVAIVKMRPNEPLAAAFPDLVNKPLGVPLAKARELLQGYNKNRSGLRRPFRATDSIIRSLASRLQTTQCPDCVGTGVSHTLVFGEPKKDS